jgi:ketosteroid isomerase-like protein
MRQFTILAVVSLAFACATSVEQSAVVAAERARVDAIAKRDAEAYRRLVAPDLVVIDQDGELLNRDDRMAAIESGAASSARRVEDDVDIRLYGDLALVMGRSDWQDHGELKRDYFTRMWVNRNGTLQQVGAHYTRMSSIAQENHESFGSAERAMAELPVATSPPAGNAEEQVLAAVREQHAAYWRKDPDRYRAFAGADLLRVAENGVTTREELITTMRANARLPAPPSDQLDVRVRTFGNAAIATWLDQGEDLLGRFSQGRFTVVLVRRGDGWQMVHVQTSGVKRR